MIFSKKSKIKLLMTFSISALICFAMVFNSTGYPSVIIWSEDFNDISEWTIKGCEWNIDSWETGNISVDNNGVLRIQGPEWNNESRQTSLIYRNSTVEKGPWVFDMFIADQNNSLSLVFFMSDYWLERDHSHIKGYDLFTKRDWTNTTDDPFYMDNDDGTPAYRLVKRDGVYSSYRVIGFYAPSEGVTGWHKIKITRNAIGQFEVFIDGILRISATDKNVTSSTHFVIEASTGQGFDNITADDGTTTTVENGNGDTTTTTTTTTEDAGPSFSPILISLILLTIVVKKQQR
jgi:hypothetical protein